MNQKRDFEPMTFSMAHKNARHLTPHLRSLGLLPPERDPEKRAAEPRITDPITHALERVLGVTPAPAKPAGDASADADPLALAKAADPKLFAEIEANPEFKMRFLETFANAETAAKEKRERQKNHEESWAIHDARARVDKLAERFGSARGGQ